MVPRRRFTKFEFAVQFLEQKGRCGCGCGARLVAKQTDEEHTIPYAFKCEDPEYDGKPDSLWTRECHKRKTKKDKADLARADRRAGLTGQRKRRETRGPTLKSRKTKIQGPGFDKNYRKKLNGKAERKQP